MATPDLSGNGHHLALTFSPQHVATLYVDGASIGTVNCDLTWGRTLRSVAHGAHAAALLT